MDIEFYKRIAREELSSLPCVTLESREDLPNNSAIYFAIDSNEKIQYIGQSKNLKQRWFNHHRLGQLEAKGGIKIAYLSLEEDLLDAVESALIEYFSPVLNIRKPHLNALHRSSKKMQSARKKTSQINVTLPDYWDKLLHEISGMTGESVSSVAARGVILYLEENLKSGLIDKIRSSKPAVE